LASTIISVSAGRAGGLSRTAVRGVGSQLRGDGLEGINDQLKAIQDSLNSIQIKTDFPALQRELLRSWGDTTKGQSEIAKSATRGMNSAARPAKTVAKRLISAKRNLPPNRVGRNLKIIYAVANRPSVEIRASGQMLPLTQLKGGRANPKQTALGVKVTATRGKRTLIKGAFIAKGRGAQGAQVFQRDSIGAGPKRVGRLPITALRTPSIAHTLVLPEISEPTIDRFDLAWLNAYEKQLIAAIRRSNVRIKG